MEDSGIARVSEDSRIARALEDSINNNRGFNVLEDSTRESPRDGKDNAVCISSQERVRRAQARCRQPEHSVHIK